MTKRELHLLREVLRPLDGLSFDEAITIWAYLLHVLVARTHQ